MSTKKYTNCGQCGMISTPVTVDHGSARERKVCLCGNGQSTRRGEEVSPCQRSCGQFHNVGDTTFLSHYTDIVVQLVFALDREHHGYYEDGKQCHCDPEVGHVCESCDMKNMLSESIFEIRALRQSIKDCLKYKKGREACAKSGVASSTKSSAKTTAGKSSKLKTSKKSSTRSRKTSSNS